MPKKIVKKTAKKAAVKAPRKEGAKKSMTNAGTVQSVAVQSAPIEVQKAEVQSTEAINKSVENVQEVSKEAVMETKEESKMADEKGVGKDYDPNEFSTPAVEASKGNLHIYLYVGISIAVIAVIIGGLFFAGVFKGGSSESLTGAAVVTAHCTDTDGGYNRFTKGVAEGTYYLDYSEGTFMDECASGEENKLTEYYCKNDLVVYATEPCPQGMTCAEGICK